MAHDIITYDAAFSVGFASFQSSLDSTVQASYQPLTNAATAFATEVDAAVLAAGGAGSRTQRGQLMQAICLAVIGGRPLISLQSAAATQSTYTPIAAAIAAAYRNAEAALL